MIPRIYTDTSVLGGCEDDEFRELALAPLVVRSVVARVPRDHIVLVALSHEAEELAQAYIDGGAIGASMRVDALHIALATVARVDVLVSWNFKHIVNLRRIHAYNAVNIRNGYPLLEIRTPREVLDDE